MKIEKRVLKRQTLQQFADEHNLTLILHESIAGSGQAVFHAFFKDVKVLDKNYSEVGIEHYARAACELSAVRAYCEFISGKFLLIADPSGECATTRIRAPLLSVDDSTLP